MRRSEPPAVPTLLHFPPQPGRAADSFLAGRITRETLLQADAHGRKLQGEAVRAGFRRSFAYLVRTFLAGAFLVGGCRLRMLRLPGRVCDGATARRQPCC